MTWFRIRIALYIAIFALFLLWYRQPVLEQIVARVEVPALVTLVAPRPTPTRTVPAPDTTPEGVPAPPPPPAAPLLPPLLGGLAAPDTVAWYEAAPTDPLAFLLSRSLHRSLLDPLGGDTARGALAQAWEMEGARATFTLRDDPAGRDLALLDATEVVARLREAMERGDLPGLRAARAVDARTVEVELAAPLCPALLQVGSWPLVAEQSWPPSRTAPGRVTEQEEGVWLVEDSDTSFRYRHFPDELSLRTAWAAGEVDGIVGVQTLHGGPLPEPGRSSQQMGPLLATLLFRMEDGRVRDPRLREALSLAVEREPLFEAAYGFVPPALLTALLPPGHWAAPTASLPAAPARAAALLDAAGWQDRDGDGTRENEQGERLEITVTIPLSSDMRWERLGHALEAQWGAVGVATRLLYLEAYSLQERLHDARWQVALLAYRVSADPDQRALWGRPQDVVGEDLNVTGFQDPAVEQLMAEGARLPGCLPAARAPYYQEAWQSLLATHALWPLFPLPLDIVYQPDVEQSTLP